MVRELVLVAVAPVLVAAAALLLGRWLTAEAPAPSARPPSRQPTQRLLTLLCSLGLTTPYLLASWILTGGPMATGDPAQRLFFIAIAAFLVGLVESSAALPLAITWVLRVATAVCAAWLLLAPLATPQQWTLGQQLWRVSAIAGGGLFAWALIGWFAAREAGTSLSLAALFLCTLGSAAIVFSGSATVAQLLGALAAGLGGVFLASCRRAAPGALRAGAPVIGLLFSAHVGVGYLYAEMPGLTFALLLVSPVGLLVGGLCVRRGPLLALIARIAAVGLVAGAGAGKAALSYFAVEVGAVRGQGSGASGTSDDESYGYD